MILTVVLPLSAGEPRRAVALAGMMAIVSGVVCVATGLARLGFITELLSKPIRYGYMNGIALTVLLSQVPKLLGFSVTANGPVRQAWGIVGKVLRGNTNLMALAIGASTLALILLLRRWPRVPGILIAVVAATGVVAAFGLAKRGVSVLGLLPQGLPSPRLPLVHVDDLVPILMGGVAVAHDKESLGWLNVTRSVWRNTVGDPKTAKSKAPVPVIPQLAQKLKAHRQRCGNPMAGPIFSNSVGHPLDLNACYQREMKDVLKRAGIVWHGWHGFRRGLASNLNRIGVDDSVIQRILRHSNVATTQNHYIKTASPDAIAAMRQFSEALLCSTCAPDEGINPQGTVQ